LNLGCGSVWSPDDSLLACESWDDSNPDLNGIYTISPADGSGLTRVTANPLGGHDIPGAYSPNGKQIVFVRFNPTDFFGVGLFVVKTNTGQVRQITSAGASLNIGADWSPQGNEIIFSRHVTDDVQGSIWVVHSDGSGLREIHIQGLTCGGSFFDPTGFGCHAPRWSPDGKKIVFAAESQVTGVNIYTANADGSGLAQVTQDGGSDDPAWGTHPLIG
jgi:Tol biopolymer transport system component